MDFLKEWTISVASTVLVATLFSIFVPKGSMAGLYKIIIGFFIFISFLLPFSNIANDKFNFDFSYLSENEEITENAVDINEKNIKSSTEMMIKSKLTEAGYDGCLVETQVNLKDDEYYIDEIVITIPSDYDKEEIKTFVYEKLQLNSTVRFNGE